ncbi:MAG: WD40 repeat protein [Halioglobus sp.]|jgi:WD40 repeat protein
MRTEKLLSTSKGPDPLVPICFILSSQRRRIIKALQTISRTVVLLLAILLAACNAKPQLDYSLSLSDAADGETGESVVAVALSADGAFAAVATIDGAVSVWDIAQRKQIQSWPQEEFGGGAQFLKFTASGKMLLLAGVDHSVEEYAERQADLNYFMILDIADSSAKRIWTMEGARLTAVSPSEDGSRILAGFSNGLMVLFDKATSSRRDYSLHTDKITDLKLSPDGKFALSGSVDTAAVYWDTATGDILQTFTHNNRAAKVAFDSTFSVGFTSDTLNNQRLWNLDSGELTAPLNHHQRWMYISTARFSANGKRLLIASPSKAIGIWNPINGENIARWHIDFPVVDVAENNRGDLVSVGSTGLVEVWKRQW